MDIEALKRATVACLSKTDDRFANRQISNVTPIPGGYSRLTYLMEIETSDGPFSIVLQYLPSGATGLVRVDRAVERDLLVALSGQSDIATPKLLASDVGNSHFDSAAFIFEAEKGGSFLQTCRDSDEAALPALGKVAATAAANVHKFDVSSLPNSMVRASSYHDYLDEQIDLFCSTEAESKSSRPFLRFMAKWLDENRPPEAPQSLVHGDFQTGNMLNGPGGNGLSLVDWELAHIGDPREDLGWFTMVCNTIPPDILQADVTGFYEAYRAATGWPEEVINPATTAYFLIISSIRTHYGMMKSSDALAEKAEQAQSVLAAYYLSITSYQHTMWMTSVQQVEAYKKERA